jgi:peptide deformylase
MTILQIVIAPDPILKKKSEPVNEVNDAIRQLMDDMVETMYEQEGIGLAAIQVGIAKRVLVMDVSGGSRRYEGSEGESEIIFMANPEIIEKSEEQNTYEEGCLSLPGQYADVVRPKMVKVKYLDYDGNEQIMEADELLATCVQHEIDHLNGIVFIDHISNVKRDIIMRKLKKQKKHVL